MTSLFVADPVPVAVRLVAQSTLGDQVARKRTWDHTRKRFLEWRVGSVAAVAADLRPEPSHPTPAALPLGGLLAAAADCGASAALTFDGFTAACGGTTTFVTPCAPGWSDRLVIGTVAFPWRDHQAAAVVATEDPGAHRLLIVDAAAGALLHEALLHSDHPAGFTIVGHPGGLGFVVDAGRGQDGTDLWSISTSAGELTLRPAGYPGRVFAGFSPEGGEILTTPHGVGDLEIFSWPRWEPRATIAAATVFATDGSGPADHFDFFADYLAPGRILVKSTEHGALVVVDRASGVPTHLIEPDTTEDDGWGGEELASFALLGRGHLVTWSWQPGRTSIRVWELPADLLSD